MCVFFPAEKIFKVTQPRFYDGRGSNEQVPAPQHMTNTLVLDLYTHDLVQLKYLAKGTADAKGVLIYTSLRYISLFFDKEVKNSLWLYAIIMFCKLSSLFRCVPPGSLKSPDEPFGTNSPVECWGPLQMFRL